MNCDILDPTATSSTLIDLLRWRALHQPDRLAYTFLIDGESDEIRMTYAELDRQARAIGAGLQSLTAAGAHALLLYPPGLDYIAAFFGCLYAGVVAIPAYPPRLNRPTPHLRAIAADSQARVALTNTTILSRAEEFLIKEETSATLVCLATNDITTNRLDDWQPPAVDSHTPAILQYTSGSTTAPRGVMVSHGNLLHNSATIQHCFGLTPDSRGVSWLPLYHDMGLIGSIVQPLYTGFPVTFMPPSAFLQRPLRWLQAISRTRATASGGPNFAYDLCVRHITPEQLVSLDLSCWKVAFNGAEPIRHETFEKFAVAFASCGFRREAFYACYGLAEATLFVSGGPTATSSPGRTTSEVLSDRDSAQDVTFVSCGQVRLGQKAIIVDPDSLTECAHDHTGEIWVTGPSVALGYWNQPEETAHTFQAYLADTGAGPFLRTGDLGFVKNGELFVTGRLKDLIIIRGINHYPQDIELTVEQSHSALRPGCGVAFSIAVDGEEQLVVAYEVERRNRNQDTHEIVTAIRRAVAEQHELQVYAVVLLKTNSLPKTTSGKLQRYLCKERFLTRRLDVVHEWTQEVRESQPTPSGNNEFAEQVRTDLRADMTENTEAIQAWLVSHISRRLRIEADQINVREPFASYGLDSITAVSLSAELEEWLGRPLSPTLAWEYPTIESLARRLASPLSLTRSRAKVDTTWRAKTDPIAIIGVSCRFPGAKNPEAFWQLLCEGVDAITEVPPDRWNIDEFYDPNPSVSGKMNTRWGGFLEQIDRFDAHFFGISPREAARMDPQQRLLLELAWEALEDAGQVPERLPNTRVGVFIGVSTHDYGGYHLDPTTSDIYVGTGNASSIAANRISYVLNLRGPSIAIDTACSSALVATHLACCSIWNGESSLALVGGVNIILLPAITVNFTKAGMMSPDGRCKAFDARANGYVRGEGAGIVILKPLSSALEDGDPIYAVIRGSAVNQDGRGNGLTAPNPDAQTAVILEACRRAAVSPGQLDYVEAHGTGTALGDPIEAKALGDALALGRSPDHPCRIGSVKTNIGHLEAASGIAGLIKVALALRHRQIPRSLHFSQPNPHIPFDKLPMQVQQELTPWPERSGPALAGVNSFGFGGTNAHIVLEEAPSVPYAQPPHSIGTHPEIQKAHLLPLSARSAEALRAMAQAYCEFLKTEVGNDEALLHNICHTASIRRSHHDHRLALVAHSPAELIDHLEAFARGEIRRGVSSGHRKLGHPSKLAFVFSGQGPQWQGMGRELIEQESVFRIALEMCDELFQQYTGWSLLKELMADESRSRLDETEIAQPAIFAMQVALATLWRSWGVLPDAVVGHSVGEVAAAHVAGVLSLDDAVRVIIHRGRLMQRATGRGKMAAVELSLEGARQSLIGYQDRLAIAAVNSPTSSVLSGDPDALEEIVQSLQDRGILCHVLPVNYAFHSHHMAPFCEELTLALEGLQPRSALLPIISTVTGKVANQGNERECFGAAYWGRNIREPVLFAAAIDRLVEMGCDSFLEVSPHPVLAGMITQCLHQYNPAAPDIVIVLPSLRRMEAERAAMLNSLGALYARGYDVDWRRLYHNSGRFVRLPSYPWQRERYWLDTDEIHAGWKGSSQPSKHPLLGHRLQTAHPCWQVKIDNRSLPYLDDHRILGIALLPGAAFMEMVLAAAAEMFGPGPCVLTELEIDKALVLVERETHTIQVSVVASEDGRSIVHIHSHTARQDDSWVSHATAQIDYLVGDTYPVRELIVPEEIRTRCRTELVGKSFYQELRELGFQYGAHFQGIERLWRGNGEALGFIVVPPDLELEIERYRFHPAVLDACGQVMLAALGNDVGTYVPVGATRIRVSGSPSLRMWSYARLRSAHGQTDGVLEGDGCLCDESGRVVVEVEGLRLQCLSVGVQDGLPNDPKEWLYEIRWIPQSLPEAQPVTDRPPTQGCWFIFADSGGIGQALANRLLLRGDRCVMVSPDEAFRRLDGDRFCLNPFQMEGLRGLLEDVLETAQPLRGVIHLWNLDALPPDQSTLRSLEIAQTLGCTSVLHLMQALVEARLSEPPRVWFVTGGVQAIGEMSESIAIAQSPIWGLGRTLAYEHPEFRCTNVDLSQTTTPEDIQALFHEVWLSVLDASSPFENQIALRGETRYVARLVRQKPETNSAANRKPEREDRRLAVPDDQPFRLEITRPGSPDNLTLRPAPRRPPGPDEVEIQVCAAGLNFRDVMKALGIYPTIFEDVAWLGDECAGQIIAVGDGVDEFRIGDEVIAIAPACMSTFTTTRAEYVVPKPPQLSFEEAATIPIAFMTAYYALHHLGCLRQGERVLIHAAAGGVGLAAVQIAQSLGAEIFATAGSPEKRDYLKSLGVRHVMDSRSTAFADEVMIATRGRGVDVVLNSLAGESLHKSLSVLGAYGRFLEIGKRDIYQNSKLGLRPFQNDLSFFSIDLGRLFRERAEFAASLFRDVVQHFEHGVFRPLPLRIFSIAEATNAFRHMAQAKHIGKIVLTPPDPPTSASSSTGAATLFRSDSTYLITGGLGELGLLVAQWMIRQGARYLALMGRSDPSPQAAETLKALAMAGARIKIVRADVAEERQLAEALADIARALPPLRGIIHAAGLVDNGLLIEMNQDRFISVMRPKTLGTWNVHKHTLDAPLDFFVLFSSAASLLGSPRQTNYSAANAFLDALAYYRRGQGLPALSIDWGPWTNLGMAARFDREGRLALRGLGRIPPDQGLTLLERLMRRDSMGQEPVQVGVIPINWQQWRAFYPAVDEIPLFAELVLDSATGESRQSRSHIRDSLMAEEPSERKQWLENYIRKEIARAMQIDPDQLDAQRPLNTLGMDSLMGIELKNRVESDLGIVFPLAAFIQGPSISQVSAELLNLVTPHASASIPAQESTASSSPINQPDPEEFKRSGEGGHT